MRSEKMTIVMMLIAIYHCQLPQSQWSISSNVTTPWQRYGLTLKEGACSWLFRDQEHNLYVSLYEDSSYNRYLQLTIFFNYSINKAYPYYNGTAHAQYQLFAKDETHEQVKDFSIMPEVILFNGSLIVQQEDGILAVKLAKEETSGWLVVITLVHFIVKITLLGLMCHSFREASNKLSLSFAYVIIGWEVQAHLMVIQVFEAGKESMFGFGIFFGLIGWSLTLVSLFLLPTPIIRWQALQGLIYYFFCCYKGILFSQASNILLYALSPILQLRFNIIRNISNSICPYASAIHLINIFMVYYFKGCPASLLRFPLDLSLCFKATFIAVILEVLLWLQQKKGPFLCLREVIQGKDFKYLEDINLLEGQRMLQEVCAICLQPLATQALLQNVRECEGRRVGSIMKTPCNHKYHPSCLRTWLHQKNTCPLDNQLIPPCFQ